MKSLSCFTRRRLFPALTLATALVATLLVAPVLGQIATPTPSADVAAESVALQDAQRLADAGDVAGAIAALQKALDSYRSAGNTNGEVNVRLYLCMYLRKLGRFDEALNEYYDALTAAALLRNPLIDGGIWLGIGDCRGRLGQAEEALAAYEEANRLYSSLSDANSQRGSISALNSAGVILHGLGRYEEAISAFEKALPLALALGDLRAEMMLQAGLGNAYVALAQPEKALALFIRCHDLAMAVDDRLWQQMALQGSAGAHSSLHQYQAAYDDAQAGATIAHKRGDTPGEAIFRMDAGLALHDMGRYAEALSELEQALALEQTVDNRLREGLALAQIGATLEALGRNEDALARYRAAEAIAEELEDLGLLSRVKNDLGLLYDLLGRRPDAEAALQAARQNAERLGDRALLGATLNNLGTLANHRADYDAAQAFYEQALAIFREARRPADEAITLNNLAQNYDSQARYDEARPLYEQALAIHRQLDDPVGEATVIENQAGQDAALGRYAQALERYRFALKVFEEKGLLFQQATGQSNLATLYLTLGRLDEARKSYEEALSLRRRIGDRAGEGVVLGNLAALDYQLGDYRAALDGYGGAATIAEEVGDAISAATWQNHVAAVLDELGQHDEAHVAYEAALKRFRELGDPTGEAASLNGLGVAQMNLSSPEEGLTYFDQAFALYKNLDDIAGQAIVLANKAALLERLGRSEEALALYRQALILRERLRGAAPGEALRVGLTRDAAAVYDAAATLAMKLREGEEAFALTERARSRALLDQLNAGRLDLAASADGALLEREQTLRSEISRLDQGVREERVKPSPQRSAERTQALSQALAARQAEYDALLTEIKAANPQYASMVSAQPAPLAEIKAHLPADITLVSYYIGVDASFAFVIRADSFHAVTLDAPAAAVWEHVAALRSSFSSLQDPSPEVINWLSDHLVASVAPYLTTSVVGVVPHGPLHYLPFAVLDWAGPKSTSPDPSATPQPFGEHFALFTLPSVSILPYVGLESPAANAPAAKDSSALVMAYGNPPGLPPLLEADAEGRAVAEVLHVEPRLDEAASESILRAQGAGRRVIHIASHGQLNSAAPLFSRLLLAADQSNDGSLEVHEVYGLDLHAADLVTLSACQTDLGQLNVGDDVTGLSRAFLYAGAKSVVASLWSVDDAATSALMQAFYRNLTAGMGKAQALAAAQASIRNNGTHPEWRHPYYWAAFVLNGDPGVTVVPRSQAASLFAASWLPWAAAGIVLALAVGAFLLVRLHGAKTV